MSNGTVREQINVIRNNPNLSTSQKMKLIGAVQASGASTQSQVPTTATPEQIARIRSVVEKSPIISRMPSVKKVLEPTKPHVFKEYSPFAYQQMTQKEFQASTERLKAVDPSKTYTYSITGEEISGAKLKFIREEEMELFKAQYEQALKLEPYHTIKPAKAGTLKEGFQIFTDLQAKAKAEWKELEKPKSIWDIGSAVVTSLTGFGKGLTIPQATRAVYVGTTRWPRLITGGFLDTKQLGKELVVEESQLWSKAKKGDVGAVAMDALTSDAMTQIVYPYFGGAAIGAGTGYVTGKIAAQYGAKSIAMGLWKTGQIGVGVGVGALAGQEVYRSYEQEGVKGLIRSGSSLALSLGFGYSGFKAGRAVPIRGATAGEWGAKRGFEKRILTEMRKGTISPELGGHVLKASQLEFQLRRGLRGAKPYQPSPKFETVQTLKKQPSLKSFMERHTLRRKSQIFGSLSEDKDIAHDIDIMYRNLNRGLREAGFGAKRLGAGEIKQFADIKPWQKTGTQVGRFGTRKQPGVKTPSGHELMRISESAMRHGESALELAHPGRVKDISRAVELYTKLFKAAKPKTQIKLSKTLSEFTKVMSELEKPGKHFIMSKQESSYLYGGKTFIERWAEFKTKTYEKYAPDIWAEKSFQKTMKYNIPKSEAITISGRGLPPSPSPSILFKMEYPSMAMSSGAVSSLSTYPSSVETYGYPSYISPTVPSRQISPSISKSISQVSKSYVSTSRIIPPSHKQPSASSISKAISSIISPVSPSPISPISPYSPYYSPTIIPPPPVIPPSIPTDLYGKGRKQYNLDLWTEQYKYREAAVYNPLKEMFKKPSKKQQRKTKNIMKTLWS